MSDIRSCTASDLPAVARLFQIAFRDRRKAAPATLTAYLQELFLEHPWRDPDMSSRVFVDGDGNVRGFLGVLPLRMLFRDRTLRAAVASSLVVNEPMRHHMAGARLLRSCLTGSQELSFSETSNDIARAMWERMGGQALAAYSMDWLRLIRPAGLFVAMAQRKFRLLRLFSPAATLADKLITRAFPNYLASVELRSTGFRSAEVNDDDLVDYILQFIKHYSLRPDWDRASLAWWLRHAAQRTNAGTFHRRIVYDRNNVPAGGYLYYGDSGQVAWVLQILALPDSADVVVGSLVDDARAQGCVAVRGRTHPHLIDSLLRHRCFLFATSAMTVHTNDAELLTAIHSGDAFLVGLAGERWTRLVGDEFA